MPKHKDINTVAFDIVNEITGDEPPTPEPEKDPNAVKRGKARAESMTAEERKELAKKAVSARWNKEDGSSK